jgi:3-oxoacyl-[acyl-carrier protein] reductase
MAMRFRDVVVFVTGAGHGIGLATARRFLEEGASVFLFDLSREALDSTVAAFEQEGHGSRLGSFAGDVRSREDVEGAVRECEESAGPIGVCVNNVGIARSAHTLELDEAEWDEIVDVTLTGVFRVGQAVARRMADRGTGVIINMGSTSGIAAEPGHAHYASAKAGVLGLTRAMAVDLAPYGLRVCAICPSEVATHPWPNLDHERMYLGKFASGRFGQPGEVASVYLYLASRDADAVNGAVLIVDGAMLAWG